MKYAHIAEIIDRISIELLKMHEFQHKSITSIKSEEQISFAEKAQAAGETAQFQENVLRARFAAELGVGSELNGVMIDAENLADVIIGAIHITAGGCIAGRYENQKREEHLESSGPRISVIAAWDRISRDACELRGQAKSFTNEAVKKLLPNYEYPVEGRTFK